MSEPLPPSNIKPQNVGGKSYYAIRDLAVVAYSPGTVEQNLPCTEVHLALDVKGMKHPLVLRLKSARAADELAGLISQYRLVVWPEVDS